jgi:Cdc6-like AAA superfamily ATPase
MEPLISDQMLANYDSIVTRLATRAEDLTDFDGTFVETIFPEILEARQHQIIYGRRGTGKTHLLRLVELRLRENFVDGGILPVYVNGSQLSQEISIVSTDPAMVALAIYVQLMQHIEGYSKV